MSRRESQDRKAARLKEFSSSTLRTKNNTPKGPKPPRTPTLTPVTKEIKGDPYDRG